MQRDSLKNIVRLSLVASAIFVLILPLAAVAQSSYNPCVVPPEIAMYAQPNILLLMDFSGSMQQQAYYATTGSFTYGGSQALDEGSTVINAAYDATNDPNSTTHPYYFGLFDNTQYYTYDYTNGLFVPITGTSASGAANVGAATQWSGTGSMPTSGLSGALLNWALTSRIDASLKALIGGKSYDSTDTNATGYVGTTTTTPVNCTSASGSCYLKAQGARRYLSENTSGHNVNAQFYIRQSTWTATAPTSSNTSANYPDDSGGWDSSGTCTSTAGSTCYPNRDLIVSINGYYNGALDTSKSPYYTKSSKKYYYDVWTFTLYQTTNVNISLTAAWPSSSNVELLVTNSANAPTTVTPGTITCSSSTCTSKTCCMSTSSPAQVQVQLSGTSSGTTYYVYAVDTNANPTGNTQIGTYAITSNVNLSPVQSYNASYGTTLTTIGGIPYARARIKTAPSALTGVVRAQWTKGRYGFVYYKGDTDAHKGRILVPCGTYTTAQDMYDFIRVVQGEPASTASTTNISNYDWQPWPYNGTPTGEAFNEVYYYLTQGTPSPDAPSSFSTHNSDAINKTHPPTDPYYTTMADGTIKAVSCRNTFVIHMSDGNWYNNSGSTTDPLPTIYDLHTKNLRPDIAIAQGLDPNHVTPITANIYSILAFADPSECSGSAYSTCDYFLGTNSMQWAAMYGGFNNLSGCTPANFPWPKTDTSLNSATTGFCMSQCTPSWTLGNYSCTGTTSPNRCCAEWNANKDTTRKGMPDNYYYAKSGAQLQQALTNIIANITQQTGSSSAVATVAQQNTEGALIIRGAFEARAPTADTADSNRYLWFGHLENFWPDRSGNYDFELFPMDTLCKTVLADSNAASEPNCWDAAMSPQWPSAASRAIYTDKNGALTLFNTTNITPTDLGLTSTDTTTRDAIVNWVLGTDSTTYRSRQFNSAGPFWILGDIVYSTPVVVGPPSLGAVPSQTRIVASNKTADATISIPNAAAEGAPFNFNKFFMEWRECDPYAATPNDPITGAAVTCPGTHVKYRDKVVYVGGNDGMVHAFLLSVYDSVNQTWAIYPNPTGSNDTNSWRGNTSTADKNRIMQIGQELWAYIPSNLLDQLPALANQTYGSISGSNVCQHRFMVDLAETAPTVFFDNEYATNHGTATYWPWHTVLMGGEREGGDTYFALDVTDPRYVDPVSHKPAPKLLWEYSVFKDVVTTFDLNAAAYSFTSACANKVAPTPTSPESCAAPKFSSTYWTGSPACGGCASGCSSGSIDSCVTSCLSQLKTALPASAAGATWQPFSSSSLYSALKTLPVSWSKPYVGRVGLPSGLTLSTCTGSTAAGTEGVCATPGSCSNSLSGVRNLAFIGGGAHVYDTSIFSGVFPSGWSQFYIDGFKHALNGTFLLALDIETGVNAFKYIWPSIYNVSRALFPEQNTICDSNGKNCHNTIPYAMSDPIALDLWNLRGGTQGEDGYTDSIYVGDMNGVFYGLKLNFDPLHSLSGSNYGIYVDIWRTKPIPVNSTTTQDRNSDYFRSGTQPITIQPAASWERNNTNAIRVLIAGGKYENITGGNSDFTDTAKMSLYNLRDTIQFDQLGGTSWTVNANSSTWTLPVTTSPPVFDGAVFADPNLNGLGIYVRSNCEPTRTTYRCIGATDATTPAYAGSTSKYPADSCIWTAIGPPGSGTTIQHKGCQWAILQNSKVNCDCCESDCCKQTLADGTCVSGTCWSCVFDLLQPGERVIGKPLIAGGLVFFTSFTPTNTAATDACQPGGNGYLYAFDYQCQPFPTGFLPIQDATVISEQFHVTTAGQDLIYGAKVNLGSGVPSQPILDPTGQNIIIQESTAQLKRVGVNLLEKMNQVQGWREQPSK